MKVKRILIKNIELFCSKLDDLLLLEDIDELIEQCIETVRKDHLVEFTGYVIDAFDKASNNCPSFKELKELHEKLLSQGVDPESEESDDSYSDPLSQRFSESEQVFSAYSKCSYLEKPLCEVSESDKFDTKPTEFALAERSPEHSISLEDSDYVASFQPS